MTETSTKIVPLDPTPEMLEAAWKATVDVSSERRMTVSLMSSRDAHIVKMRDRYKAMIEAAPVLAPYADGVRVKIEAALKRVAYEPGDHPIVPVKHAAFVEEVRAALAAPKDAPAQEASPSSVKGNAACVSRTANGDTQAPSQGGDLQAEDLT